MEYCITMERTQRVAVTFTADNDDQAIEKAAELNRTAAPTDFEAGAGMKNMTMPSAIALATCLLTGTKGR